MVVQEYVLHLANGDNIVASEPYELEGPKTILNRFIASRTKPDMMIHIWDLLAGSAYIPWSSVVYIHTGDVVETDRQQDFIWKLYGVNQQKNEEKDCKTIVEGKANDRKK